MSREAASNDLLSWALALLGANASAGGAALSAVAGDASSRRYYRLALPGRAYIVAEAPPATDKNEAFLAERE